MKNAVLDREISDEELEKLLQNVKAADKFNASCSGADSISTGDEALTDEFGFPFEPEGYYNSAPIEFEEIAKALWTILTNTNYAATRYNRLSPYYTMLMGRLEKDIRQMGSFCITKAVLEQSGQKFPDLDIINVRELYLMVSVHFRKCGQAYNDLQNGDQGQDVNLIGWIFRWAALAERLKSTQEKINNIKQGKINIDTLISRETVYKGDSPRQRDRSANLVAPRVRASSLPILKSYTNEVKMRRRDEEMKERALHREAERAARRIEKISEKIPEQFRDHIIKPHPLPKIPGTGLNLNELRLLLMDDAKRRGDMAESEIIAHENEFQLIDRFQKFQQMPTSVNRKPDSRNGPGPSAETRKKLREKRKKKK